MRPRNSGRCPESGAANAGKLLFRRLLKRTKAPPFLPMGNPKIRADLRHRSSFTLSRKRGAVQLFEVSAGHGQVNPSCSETSQW